MKKSSKAHIWVSVIGFVLAFLVFAITPLVYVNMATGLLLAVIILIVSIVVAIIIRAKNALVIKENKNDKHTKENKNDNIKNILD